MKGLGFNIYIYPEGQDISEVYDKGFASKTMPESYVTTLANSNIVTVNHLLPTLTRKLVWPEYKRTIVLTGIRGEEPLAHRDPKKPLQFPVKPGTITLGYELHNSLDLKVGDTVSVMGTSFIVAECHSERGSVKDITINMNLLECQQLLGEEGRINAILALECNCATVDRLGEVRKELLKILPGTTIIEKQSQALGRAEARIEAGKTAKATIQEIKDSGQKAREKIEQLAMIIIPLICVLCMASIAMLTFLNVKDRIYEIGILTAIGVQFRTVLKIFLIKSIMSGVAGSVLGVLVTYAIIKQFRAEYFYDFAYVQIISDQESLLALFAIPVMSVISAWLPVQWAAQRDPAEVLRND